MSIPYQIKSAYRYYLYDMRGKDKKSELVKIAKDEFNKNTAIVHF